MNALDLITERLFDYAGMFPPAALSFDNGLQHTAQCAPFLHRPRLKAADYVVTWEHLNLLTPANIREKGFAGNKFTVVLLGSPVEDDFERYLDELREAAEWGNTASDPDLTIEIESFEIKCAESAHSFVRFLASRREELEEISDTWEGKLFIESNELSRTSSRELVEALTTLNSLNQHLAGITTGIKVRGAGEKAITNSDLALLIEKLRVHPVPLKATAGFHHPIIERDRYGNDLGFLNILTALFLASADERFTETDIRRCLETEDRALYDLSSGLGWSEFQIPLTALRKIKDRVFFRIGSCSVEEPDGDLKRIFPD